MFAKTNRLGSGIHASAYEYEDSDKLIVYATSEYAKLQFIEFLGLTASDIVDSDSYEYEVLVVKLEGLSRYEKLSAWGINGYELYDQKIEPEIRKFERTLRRYRREYGEIEAIERIYRYRGIFPIHKPVIEFMYEYRHEYEFTFDTHRGNYLVCPVTGKVFPYDCVMFHEISHYSDSYFDSSSYISS